MVQAPAGAARLSHPGERASLSRETPPPLLVSEKVTAWLLSAFWAGVRSPPLPSKSGQGVLRRTARTLHGSPEREVESIRPW